MGRPEEELQVTRGLGTMMKQNSVAPSRVMSKAPGQSTTSDGNSLTVEAARKTADRQEPDGSTHGTHVNACE